MTTQKREKNERRRAIPLSSLEIVGCKDWTQRVRGIVVVTGVTGTDMFEDEPGLGLAARASAVIETRPEAPPSPCAWERTPSHPPTV